MSDPSETTSLEAVRLLAWAIQRGHHDDMFDEDYRPQGASDGELILIDALISAARGHTAKARERLEDFEGWQRTGVVPERAKPPARPKPPPILDEDTPF